MRGMETKEPRELIFNGSLWEEIDAVLDDPDLHVS